MSALARSPFLKQQSSSKSEVISSSIYSNYPDNLESTNATGKPEEPTRTEELEDPSTEERVLCNRAELKIIASIYALQHIESKVRTQLFNQIDWLLSPENWEDEDKLANKDSFKTLIKFILNFHPTEAPYLGLSSEGNLLAEWRQESNKLSLECLPQEKTKWFVSCTIDGEGERASGEAPSLRRLLNLLEPYKKVGWFNESEKHT
jgi:hypothetical protein